MGKWHFTVMGTASEKMLARLINAMRDVRESNGENEEHNQILSDTLNEAEEYLLSNEQFVDRLAARGDMS